MKKLFLCALFLADLLITGWAPSLALTNTPATSYDGSPVSGKVIIRGVVPTMRFIYVDNQDKILSVVGNTDQNISPRVIRTATYKDIELSAYVVAQYQTILAANGGHLQAGLTYHLPFGSDQLTQDNQTGAPFISSLKLSA